MIVMLRPSVSSAARCSRSLLWSISQSRSQTTDASRPALLPSRINSPTTLPPPLVLPPERRLSEYRVQHLYKTGRSYLKFYKTGAKQIWNNRKTVKQIRAQHADHPLLKSIPGSNINLKTGQVIEIDGKYRHETLSRAEYQLLRRHAKDIKKVPIFGVLFAIFGEWLPLFVIFLDPLIPGTVLLPRQVLKRRRKSSLASNKTASVSPHGIRGDLEGAGVHDHVQLVTVARQFSLLGPISKYFSSDRLLRGIRRHERYLSIDDALLLQESSLPLRVAHVVEGSSEGERRQPDLLDPRELELAVEERGMWRENQTTEQRLRLLNQWLEKTQHTRKAGNGEC